MVSLQNLRLVREGREGICGMAKVIMFPHQGEEVNWIVLGQRRFRIRERSLLGAFLRWLG